MITNDLTIQSRHNRDELIFASGFFVTFDNNLKLFKQDDNLSGLILLNEAYSDDEPVYTHEDLIWKNPNYDPSR
ncbi:hypothetical protein [Leptospira sp. 'Mane']|uniref:hypothetical protein n=1 Tax=Leptospira sp. 'Mane' TaxID=3387407 RepID=UPI00398AD520